MPKDPKRRRERGRRPGRRSAPMGLGTKAFLAACGTEAFLLALRRFYVYGTLNQIVAWYDRLPWIGAAGAAVFCAGALWAWWTRSDAAWRGTALAVAGLGAAVGAASGLAWWSQPTVDLMAVLLPAGMLLCVFWGFYDRACALSLTALGISVAAAWICSRGTYQASPHASLIRGAIAAYMALLAVGALLMWRGRLTSLVPARLDPLPVYISCALSAAALVVSLLSPAAAWYAMWCLALVMFGMVVYSTVKQL